MAVDLRKIKKLIELVEESGVAELEVSDGDETIRIARPVAGVPVSPATSVASTPGAAPASVETRPPAADAVPQTVPARPTYAVTSPMAGTFYRAPGPGEAPFVEVGQAVAAGDVVCIIESMKMMNEVLAEKAGVCTAVAVENGQPVGSGDVLFRFA